MNPERPDKETEARLDALLDRWEEARAEGRPIAAADLCRDVPELREELERRIRALESMDRLLGPAPPDPLSLPATAAGRYRALRLHAKGNLGEVYVAVDEELHREVALKRIQRWIASDPDARARFLQEAEITSRLEHPGIVPVYGQGEDEKGLPCYAMRLVGGQTLDAALLAARGDPVRRRQLLQAVLAACHAVAYAHSRGVVHRDLKPANILLGEYGETLVVDWGLAKPVDAPADGAAAPLEPVSAAGVEGTRPGARKGSPAYMSPEQAAGGVATTRSDVYGLGATLYKVLTGRPPLAGGGELFARVQKGGFPPPRAVDRSVPRPLDAICRKALHLDPAQRYGSATDLARDLERWLAGEPVTAWPEPWWLRLRRWTKRHRAVAAAVAAAICVGIAGLVVVAEERRRSADSLRTANAELRDANARERASTKEARAGLYASLVAQAEQELALYHGAAAQRALDGAPPELRGIEWRLLARRLRIDVARFDAPGRGLAFGADGARLVLDARLAVALADGTVSGDASGGAQLVALTADGRRAATRAAVDAETLTLWEDGARGAEVAAGASAAASFFGEGKLLVTVGADGVLKIWRTGDGSLAGSHAIAWPPGEARAVEIALAPNAQRLAVLRHGPAGLDFALIDTTRQTLSAEPVDLNGGVPPGPITSFLEVLQRWQAIAFSADGARVAVAVREGRIALFDTASGRLAGFLEGHQGPVRSLAYLPDGRLLSGAADRTVRLWDAQGRSRVIGWHDGGVVAVAADAERGRVASRAGRDVRVWSLAKDREGVFVRAHEGGVRGLAVGPGFVLTGGADGAVRLWDPATGAGADVLAAGGPPVGAVAASRDGTLLAWSAGGEVVVWDRAAGARRRTLANPGEGARTLAFRPDNGALAAGASDMFAGVLVLWDLSTGDTIATTKVGSLPEVCFTPDGARLVLVSADLAYAGREQFFDARTGAEVEDPTEPFSVLDLMGVAYSADGGKAAWGGKDGRVEVVDVAHPRQRFDLQGHDESVADLFFNPAGDRLVLLTLDPGPGESRLAVWDVPRRRHLLTLRGPTLTAALFTADGEHLVSVDEEGGLRIR